MIVDVKSYVEEEKAELKKNIAAQYWKDPSLLILQRGNDPTSNSYIKGKIKDCKEVGIRCAHFNWFNGASEAGDFLVKMATEYNGIILQEPTGLTEEEEKIILKCIQPNADVDGFLALSCHEPCTPKGIMEIIHRFYGRIEGKVITVIGKGKLVGMPLVPMLMREGATVISCNSKTPNISKLTLESDIVVSATGKPNLVTKKMLKDDAFVIDAGISVENGKLCGDCDKSLYDDTKIRVTPVPGGVGLMTRLELLKNVARAADIVGVE